MKLHFDRNKTRIAAPFALSAILAGRSQAAEKPILHTVQGATCNHSALDPVLSSLPQADEAPSVPSLHDNLQEGWTPTHQKRFHALAVKEALDSLSPQEANELRALSDRRRQEESPRTGEEVIREFKQYQLTRNLIKALSQFVDFYEPTSSSQGTSER